MSREAAAGFYRHRSQLEKGERAVYSEWTCSAVTLHVPKIFSKGFQEHGSRSGNIISVPSHLLSYCWWESFVLCSYWHLQHYQFSVFTSYLESYFSSFPVLLNICQEFRQHNDDFVISTTILSGLKNCSYDWLFSWYSTLTAQFIIHARVCSFVIFNLV